MDWTDERRAKSRKSLTVSMPSHYSSTSTKLGPETRTDSNSFNSNIKTNAKASNSSNSSSSSINIREEVITSAMNGHSSKVRLPSSSSSDALALAELHAASSPLSSSVAVASSSVPMVSPMSVEPTTLKKEYTSREKLSTPSKQGLYVEIASTRREPKKRKNLEEVWLQHFYSTIQYHEDMEHLDIPLSYVIESQGSLTCCVM